MKIGIDIRTLMDEYYTGVSEYTINLVKALLRVDEKNDYVLFYNSFFNIEKRIPKFESHKVKVIRKKYPNKILNYGLFKVFDWPKLDNVLNCDLLFLPHINFASKTKKSMGVLTIHDLSFLRYGEFFSLRKNFWHWIINVKELVALFDYVIAISENTKRDIIELLGVPENKIKVIYSCVDDSMRQVKYRSKISLPKNFFLCLGTMEPRKNLEVVIEAYVLIRKKSKKYDNYKLVIAGSNGWRSAYLYEMIKKTGFEKDIIILGYVDIFLRNELYKKAVMLIFPSIYEGFGFPPLEAALVGTPVITSNTTSMPEILGKNAFLVDPLRVNEVALLIQKILTNINYSKDNTKKINQEIKTYKWDDVALEYVKIFEKNIKR